MIKIAPYYERSEQDRKEILEMYLEMVADVVPFLRSDVLYDFPVTTDGKPRNRTKTYINILEGNKVKLDASYKEQDALLARKLISDYSRNLHDFIYEGIEEGSCHVNPQNLRHLLTFKMPHGILPELFLNFHNKKRKSDDLLNYVFRYETFSKHSKIYIFLQALGVDVCPYCNRQYITTVGSGERRTRPQLDHFKNKNKYPFLALSINNLVPSCGVCNLMKHENDLQILYPYEDEMGDLFIFSTDSPEKRITSILTGAACAPEDFIVKLEKKDPAENSLIADRAANSISEFALRDLYQSHKNYITDLYFHRYIHTEEAIEDTINQFPRLFSMRKNPARDEEIILSDEEIKVAKETMKRRLALIDYQQEMWGKRPLAKLTHDIMQEINSKDREDKQEKGTFPL